MIDESNIEAVLEQIGYLKEDGKYKKFFSKVNCFIEVDFKSKKIKYPEEIEITAQVTTNFAKPENFVVLECVTRLLDKGYQPKDIELEKTWKLGHELKGASSDICVSGLDGKILFIIECKTAGTEFDKEYQNMLHDGGQLFSYWHQERSCQRLVLYTSDFIDGTVKYIANSVDCHDDNAKHKKIYRDAGNVKELFEVWSKTYEQKFCGDVIFNDDTVAYQIGVKPLLKKYLKDLDEDNKIVNKFEEILRHNNISDKENAFNRLMALFICKLTDESKKSAEDELEFQYRAGTDDFESFQDRLQRLHRDGMNDFMDEDIFYVPINFVEDMVRSYTGQNRNNLIHVIDDKLRKLKFYTNSDFAFKEVHNEKLFEQNAKILIEVVELFQNYKIIGAKNLQLLGDLFEQLLNKGFKQNEGQFFTPLPITRFIWDSLPLEKLIESPEELPKIIDYACGAGHFLTQGFEALNNFVSKKFGAELSSDWVSGKLFGIEKDYRLARVSKISLFMHGAGNGNIIFGDGLENYSERDVTKYSFDILVANPPYSVAAFKNHLNLSNAEDFEVLEKISIDGSEIETLFVERIAQLLKPKGIAAVILPSSVLNKENSSFVAARSSILKNFYIRAIVQLGSKTFGATGTNTVILFLEKFDEPPKRTLEVEDSLDAIFELRNLANWEDELIYKSWLQRIDVNENIYKTFISRQRNFNEWANDEYFGQYYSAFVNSREYINKIAQPSFIKFSNEEKLSWCNQKFYDFSISIEREKLRYFAYVYKQKTLIVTAPNDNKLQEKFLGYKWSNRKGQEGMQYVNEGGLLYDKNNREAENTIAALVRKIFNEQESTIDELNDYYYYLNLQDMIDFKGINFTKAIRTSQTREKNFDDGKLYKLSDENIFEISIGRRVLSNEIIDDSDYPVYSANVFEPFGRINKLIINDFSRPSIIWGIDGDWMVNLIEENQPFYPTDHCGVIRIKTDDILPKYLMITLQVEGEHERFSRSNRASTSRIKNLSLFIPSLDVQKKILDALNVEDKIQMEESFIKKCDENIKNKFDEMFAYIEEKIEINDCCIIEKGESLTREQAINGDVPVVAGGISPSCYHNKANRPANIITISASGKNAGYVNFWTVPIFATDCNTLMSKNDFQIEFIYHALKNEQKEIYKLQRGSAQPHVYGSDILKIKIPNASMEEQKKFAEYAQLIESQKVEAITRKENLIAKREEIINKYFK